MTIDNKETNIESQSQMSQSQIEMEQIETNYGYSKQTALLYDSSDGSDNDSIGENEIVESTLTSYSQKQKRQNRIITILVTKKLNKEEDDKGAIKKTLHSTAILVADWMAKKRIEGVANDEE